MHKLDPSVSNEVWKAESLMLLEGLRLLRSADTVAAQA